MFRIGEKVKTPKGLGHVAEVRSFMQEGSTLSDEDFTVFAAEQERIYGEDYLKKYQNVLVQHGKVLMWYRKKDLKLVESRGG